MAQKGEGTKRIVWFKGVFFQNDSMENIVLWHWKEFNRMRSPKNIEKNTHKNGNIDLIHQ